MALDIYIQDSNQYIFGLNDERYNCLYNIFKQFKNITGIYIDQYTDTKLDTKNIKRLIELIDRYIERTDLSKNKKETSIILEFKGLLNIFIENNYSIRLHGD
jgi:hypothetical protein